MTLSYRSTSLQKLTLPWGNINIFKPWIISSYTQSYATDLFNQNTVK